MKKILFILLVLLVKAYPITISDNFNRVDAALRSGNYVDGVNYAVVHSNAVASNNTGNVSYSLWKNNIFGENQFMQVTVDTLMVLSDNYCKTVICADSMVQNSGYHTLIRYYGLQIYARWSNVKIGEYLNTLKRNDVIRTYTYGDSVYASINHAIVFRALNDSLRGIKIGIGGRVGSTQDYSRVDNLYAGDFDGVLDYDTNTSTPFNVAVPPIIDSIVGVYGIIDTIKTVDTITVYGDDFKSSGANVFIGVSELNVVEQTDSTILVYLAIVDTGNLQLYVTDSAGNTVSKNVFVQRSYIPITITTQPRDTAIVNSGLVNFSVAATVPETIHYQWVFNGSNFGTDANSISATVDTSHDSSLIYCKVWSVGGDTVVSDTALLRVWTAMVIDSVGIYRGVLFKGFFPYTIDSVKIDGMDGSNLIQTGDSIFEFTPPFALMWQRSAFVVTFYSNGIEQSIDLYFDKNRKSTGNNKTNIGIFSGFRRRW